MRFRFMEKLICLGAEFQIFFMAIKHRRGGSAALANEFNDKVVFPFVPSHTDQRDFGANGEAVIKVFENETVLLIPLLKNFLAKGFRLLFTQNFTPTALRAARQMAWGTEFDVCETCTMSSVQTWPSGKFCLGTNQAVVSSTQGDFSMQ